MDVPVNTELVIERLPEAARCSFNGIFPSYFLARSGTQSLPQFGIADHSHYSIGHLDRIEVNQKSGLIVQDELLRAAATG